MADTKTQHEVADWVREEWLPGQFGQPFDKQQMPLSSGGVYQFNAVSEDHTIIAAISTSGATTASGNLAVGKLLHIRSDMFFLLLVNEVRRVVVLTELDMYKLCLKERSNGRVPLSIEFLHAEIPEGLRERLENAATAASREMLPKRLDNDDTE